MSCFRLIPMPALLLFLLLGKSVVALCSDKATVYWPRGMSFVGLTDQQWQLYVVKQEGYGPVPIDIGTEPRTPVYSPTLNIVVYVSASGDLVKHDIESGNDTVLLPVGPEVAYTQPFLSSDRQSAVVVHLQQAKSKQTRILEVDLESGQVSIISQQRTAQFEPYIRNDILYYTNVQCIENCAGRYVHEIWEKNLISQDARQLTLLNSQTYQPVVEIGDETLIVSSVKSGVNRIWQCSLASEPPIACTVISSDSLADTSPSVDQRGRLYFLRRLQEGPQQIVLFTEHKKEVILPLPPLVEEVRDLEIGL